MKDLMRRAPAQTLSGPMIEAICGALYLLGNDFEQAHPLGKVVTQQAIGISLQPPLPSGGQHLRLTLLY